ncbi:transmembrane channel-like protein 7 [Diorhabda sublineata]|uniref:transmembrane channel-like protein 7 n=1 Tax=Diorhabda sublineata TaxID=1163346 RepID=UPI0024E15C36|nr:transmembrane channel-like protein 7 [Diorhabda sublineata]
MSGGANRKKTTRSQGWEEAGSEFYQESYPADSEIEALQRDPKHLHTLLPSKLNRGAATIRIKTNDYRTNNRTIRRHTATRSRRESTVHRRTSTAGEVQVSMLPDLSEMRSNEQTAWEEIMQIKSLPIPMSEKKEMKAKILNEPNLRLQGYEQFKWKRRKMWDQLKSRLQESLQNLELWRGSMKYIEGNFGTGVVAYFLFVRWLFILNLFIFCLVFLFINLPTILLDFKKNITCTNSPNTSCCAQEYFNETTSENNVLIDFVQGTGFLEKTLLFYGFYTNEILEYAVGGIRLYYNVPVAYMFVVIICFGLSVFSILTSAANGFRERLIEGEGQFYHYCNMVFGGWDFCIDNEKSAKIKQKLIYNEFKANVETERLNEEIQSRTTQEKYKIYFCRFIVNTVVFCILACCGYIIYLVFMISTGRDQVSENNYINLFFEFLPALTIVGMNIVVPILFKFLLTFEKYKPLTALKFSLMRTVFLRLSALIVLYASLWSKIKCTNENELSCVRCPKAPTCWESYVGQQIYKLLLTDFAIQIIMTFIINVPRAVIARHISNRFVKLFCEQTFDLPRHALDVVYSQTLIWFGIFYTPLISLIGTGMFFFIFYIKKFACVYNCRPSPVIYRASRSNSMFMLVLLISFAFAAFPLGISFSDLHPSRSCGPFRDRSTVWNLAVSLFLRTPQWIQSIIFFLGTAGFGVPCIIVLTLILYYYMGVNSANRHLVSVLKNQLVLEGHDKQFLLDRLSLFIKQENQKRLRAEQRRGEGDMN